MDSDQSIVEGLLMNDYASLVIMVAIGYDYLLTLSKEVEYVWNKPWTFVSTLFVFIRYCSLCTFLTLPLVGSSLLPGPPVVSETLEIFATWTVMVFILTTDLVMILRVWAMYHQSRIILGMLLVSYTVELVPSVVSSIIYSNPNIGAMSVSRIQRYSYCTMGPITLGWNKTTSITQLIHATVMCTLVVVQFIMQSFEMYTVTKRWRLNQFMNLLVVEGVLYFLFLLAWNIVNMLYAWGVYPVGWEILPVGIIEIVPIATLAPRFVLSVRELYARNVRGERSDGIDAGFGFSTISGDIMTASTMVFAQEKSDEEQGFTTA